MPFFIHVSLLCVLYLQVADQDRLSLRSLAQAHAAAELQVLVRTLHAACQNGVLPYIAKQLQ